MANSITLSTALVSDIQAKINAGTATAEEVVLYTKGLNQLQTGNDFQSVAVGLAQSAVDSIDSANAQFQEDAQNALDTFKQTADTIDSKSANAVTAMNLAKDALLATDVEITSTINSLPSISVIENSTYKEVRKNKDIKGWNGVHALPSYFKPSPKFLSKEVLLDHPYKTPMAIMALGTNSSYTRTFMVMDHNFQPMDEITLTRDSHFLGTAGVGYTGKGMIMTRYQDWGMRHPYALEDEDQPAAGNANHFGMTGYMNQYGSSRYISTPDAYRGADPGFITTTNQVGGNEHTVAPSYCAVIVGDSRKDWVMARQWLGNYMKLMSSKDPQYAGYGRMSRINRKAQSDFWTTNESSTFEYMNNLLKYSPSDYTGDWLTHDRVRFNSYNNTGAGLIGYNHNTKKFIYTDVDSPAAYRWKPKLFTVNANNDLRNIALGKEALAGYDQDLTTSGVLTLNVDGTICPKEKANVVAALADVGAYDRYTGNVVLCDNDSLIYQVSYDHAVNKTRYIRLVKNVAGDDFEYDTHFDFTRSNGLGSTDYATPNFTVSNDGRYVCLFDSYYYYGSGINLAIVRVADGATLYAQYGDTGRGFNVIAHKHKGFLIDRNWTADSTSTWNPVDCDYLFATYNDQTNVSAQIFSSADHREYHYSFGMQQVMGHVESTRSYTMINIYNPYGFMFDYFDANGNLKPGFDKDFNAI